MKRRIIKKLMNKAIIIADCKDINLMINQDLYPYNGAFFNVKHKKKNIYIIITKQNIVKFITNYRYNKITEQHPYEKYNK